MVKTLKELEKIEKHLNEAHKLSLEALAISLYHEGKGESAMKICQEKLGMKYDKAGKWLSDNS